MSAASPYPVFETIFENLADVPNFDVKDKVYLTAYKLLLREEA